MYQIGPIIYKKILNTKTKKHMMSEVLLHLVNNANKHVSIFTMKIVFVPFKNFIAFT